MPWREALRLRPILNVLINRECKVEFVKAKDCSGKVKDGKFIAEDFISVIMSRTVPKNVVAVCTNNACRSSWPYIKAACPWVVCLAAVGTLTCARPRRNNSEKIAGLLHLSLKISVITPLYFGGS